MKNVKLTEILMYAEKREPIPAELALWVLNCDRTVLHHLMAVTNDLREKVFSNKISICSIINAKCGGCAEDCKFCAQSINRGNPLPPGRMMDPDDIATQVDSDAIAGVARVGIVTSGNNPSRKLVGSVCSAVQQVKSRSVQACASLGVINSEALKQLRAAGITRYHHNLETAESFFDSVCTTHSYKDRLATLERAREAGLQLCSGGILGLGETEEQCVELAGTLQKYRVDSIPLNFLVPIPGSPFGHLTPMKPMDMIRCIVMFRLMNPYAEIRVCAGRVQMGDLQSWMFAAGA
ncbi:MAG: biotin synthase BioB, partial [Lentisphaerae bacterium]|nr:biotin synthase BioB [Lentisphaerota bacterium]